MNYFFELCEKGYNNLIKDFIKENPKININYQIIKEQHHYCTLQHGVSGT